MGVYDFTTRPDRLTQHSVKWKTSEQQPDLLQLWVADMDFEPMPAIREALTTYANQHIYGYSYASDSLYQAILDWERQEHGYVVERESVVLIDGVVPALSVAIQALTQEGDAVLINTPVYPPFARTVRLNQRKLISHSLQEVDGEFCLDLERLEADFQTHQVKLYLLCNPHNPGGRVWRKQELAAIGRLCQRYGVLLVSDEIHQDLTLYGHRHHSLNTVDPAFKDFSIVLSSATKTFNIAGTKNSFALIENPKLRKAFTRRQLANNQHEIATVGLIATEAAFRHGRPWLDELRQTLEKNIDYLTDYVSTHTQIRVMKPQATYLVWLDFSAYGLSHPALQEKLVDEARLVLNDGLTFGKEGEYRFRLNVAAPLATIEEACQRLGRVFGEPN